MPKYLMDKILTSKITVPDERKQVTVLFADIKGSLEIIADRDAEGATRFLDAVLERMMDAVHRYEGTVNRVMGDGILALFGVPIAHENHALRACYAALMMQESVTSFSTELRRTEGLNVQIRVGVNSGEVIVHSIRKDLELDYTVVGLTAHLAARMEQIATPGTIVITPDVQRLVEGYVDVSPLGAVPIKGLSTPLEVYQLIGASSARSRVQASAARGLTRFVGRGDEIATLHETLQLAQGGQGQVVAVIGEAGIGKSRLIHEFVHSEATRGWLTLETTTVSYGRATPYLPIIDLLRDYFKINQRDDVRTVRERITGRLLTLDQSFQNLIPPLFWLLDVLPTDHQFYTLDPIQRRQQTVQAFKRLIVRESRLQPLILVFEDLHWTDSLSIGLIQEVVDSLPDDRIIVVVSYRSEYHEQWDTRSYYRQMRLAPLQRASIDGLLEALVGSDPTLLAVRKLLIERAEGNPFFLEELVRSLVETKVLDGERGKYRVAMPISSIKVPPQVQSVIAARIDRLPAAQKQLLQEASVIGKNVPFELLTMISGEPEDEVRDVLAELQTAEFLQEAELFPNLEFTFKHSLTHKTAYEALLHERRRDIHSRIVDAIERLHSARITEHCERLAHHAFMGEAWPKALQYLREAGRKAANRPANREAVVLFQQALQALGHLPQDTQAAEQSIDVRFEIRNSLQPLGALDEIAECLRDAETLALRIGDRRRLGWISSYFCEHFRMLGSVQKAEDSGNHALVIAKEIGDLSLRVVSNLPMGLLYHALGQYHRAAAIFKWNIDQLGNDRTYDRFGLFGLPSVFSRTFLAYCLAETGEFHQAVIIGDEAMDISMRAEHPFSQVYANLGVGYVSLRKGDFQRAIAALERGLNLSQFAQIPVGFSYGASYLGYALALSGQLAEGIRLLEETIEPGISTKFVARHSLRVAYLAEAYLLAGRVEDSAHAAGEALELARGHQERGHEAYALKLLGDVAAYRNEPSVAEPKYSAALSLAEELQMRPLAAHCHWALAHVIDRGTDLRRKEAHAKAGRSTYHDLDMTGWLQKHDAEAFRDRDTRLSGRQL
jgi:class 3 adenylate cyclase/tetratricopeptide (TPR) repeat protein